LLLGIEKNFIAEFHFSNFRERLKSIRPRQRIAASTWHSPSNAHTYRLYVVKERCLSAVPTSDQRSPRF